MLQLYLPGAIMSSRFFAAAFRVAAFAAVLPVFPSLARAESLSLTQALAELNQSPRWVQAKSIAEESSWKRVEAFSIFLPTLNATASHLLGKKYLLTDIALGGSPISIPQIL